MSDQPARALQPDSTHAVDIFAFVEAQEIPSAYFETLYFLAPAPGDEHAYAALRETLRSTRKIGIAYVVLHARPHIAALLPQGESLVLNTLRYADQPGQPGITSGPERLNCLLADGADTDGALSASLRGSGTPWLVSSEHWQSRAQQPGSGPRSSFDHGPAGGFDSGADDSEEGVDLDDAFEDECLASILRHSRHPGSPKVASRAAQAPQPVLRYFSGLRSRMRRP